MTVVRLVLIEVIKKVNLEHRMWDRGQKCTEGRKVHWGQKRTLRAKKYIEGKKYTWGQKYIECKK